MRDIWEESDEYGTVKMVTIRTVSVKKNVCNTIKEPYTFSRCSLIRFLIFITVRRHAPHAHRQDKVQGLLSAGFYEDIGRCSSQTIVRMQKRKIWHRNKTRIVPLYKRFQNILIII